MEGAEELIALLCTQIGMIMEDACPVALTIGSMTPTARKKAIARLHADIRILERLIAAVIAIAD